MNTSWETFPGLNSILEDPKNTVATACKAIESCIDANRDNLRGFIEGCFSLLLKCIFGYEGSSWLNTIAKGGTEADAKALVSLLSPGSKLLQAIHGADADSLIKFIFPPERLPSHTQLLLVADNGRQELACWPQYAKCIVRGPNGRAALHLTVFNYYVFWTAFYVLRGSQTAAPELPAAPRHGRLAYSGLAPSLGTVRKTLRLGRGSAIVEGHAYLRLLRSYLDQYLPRTAQQKASNNAIAAASPVKRARMRLGGGTGGNEGGVLLGVLLEFWLSDGDQPLPAGPSQDSLSHAARSSSYNAFGSSSAISGTGFRAYEAPSEDLVEAVQLLTRYVFSLEDERSADTPLKPAQLSGFHWLPAIPQPPAAPALKQLVRGLPPPPRLGPAANSAAQAYSKRLFRFLFRAMSRWPEQRSLSSVTQLWLAAIAPWWPPGISPGSDSPTAWRPASAQGAPAFAQREAAQRETADGSDFTRRLSGVIHRVGNSQAAQHRPDQGKALAPRYTAEWETHVLANLPLWRILLPIFLDRMLSRVSSQGDAALADLHHVLKVLQSAPALAALLKGAEAALAPPGLLHRTPEARHESAGFADLVPWLTDQAQEWAAVACATLDTSAPPAVLPEMQIFGDGPNGGAARVQRVLKAAKGAVREELLRATAEAAAAVLPMASLPDVTPQERTKSQPDSRPVQGALRLGRWQDLQYKGDWMRRPISSNEIGWLVRLLLLLSDLGNRWLYLQGSEPPAPAAPSFPLAMLLSAHAAVRVRGWRMNLRPLAEIQTLLWLPVAFLLLWACWHVLLLLWSGLTAPYEDSSAAVVQPAASSRQLPHQHRHPAYAHHAKQRT